MLLFLAAIADDPDLDVRIDVAAPLDRLALETGYFGLESARRWTGGPLAVATLCHSPEAIGAARHVAISGARLAAFAGRPVRSGENGAIDGRGCLDAAIYLEPPERWAAQLDGRFAVLVADVAAGELVVVTDPLGQYPVYSARARGATLVSNNARLLADLAGSEIRAEVAACALVGEFAPDGRSLWESVATLRPGSTHRLAATRREPEERWRPMLSDLFAGRGRPGDPVAEGASRLRESARAFADWPGRPSAVPLSGGHDSRLVFAAFEAAGVDADVRTVAELEDAAYPETTDVRIARRVAAAVGHSHRVVPQYDPPSYVAELARFSRISPGTFSIRLTLPLEPAPPGQPLELVHSGQNGEWMRGPYGGGTTLREVERNVRAYLLPRVPPPLVTDDAYATVHDWLRRTLAELIDFGFREMDLADAFGMTQEVPTYGPPSHRVYEYRYDTTFPLCSAALAPAVLGRPQAERARATLGERMVIALVPALRGVPYDSPDGGRLPAAALRALQLTRKVGAELRRRRVVAQRRRSGALQRMPFVEMHAAVGRAYREGVPHPALALIHRGRLERVLHRDPWAVTPRDRRSVFMLGTWLLAPPPDGTGGAMQVTDSGVG